MNLSIESDTELCKLTAAIGILFLSKPDPRGDVAILVREYAERYSQGNHDRVEQERDKAIKTIENLREGFARLAKMYEGGDIEPFCLQILDHTKEYATTEKEQS